MIWSNEPTKYAPLYHVLSKTTYPVPLPCTKATHDLDNIGWAVIKEKKMLVRILDGIWSVCSLF